MLGLPAGTLGLLLYSGSGSHLQAPKRAAHSFPPLVPNKLSME